MELSRIGTLRIDQVIGNKKLEILGLLPMGKTTWYAGIKSGRFPRPIKLSKRISAWRVSDIQALLEQGLVENSSAE